MNTKGKVVKIRTVHEAHGIIHGFETSNGVPACNWADTTLHVMNYLEDLLVSRIPLPMGLHCQTSLRSGAGVPKELLVAATSVTLCMLPSGTPGSEDTTNSTAQQMQKANSKCCIVL